MQVCPRCSRRLPWGTPAQCTLRGPPNDAGCLPGRGSWWPSHLSASLWQVWLLIISWRPSQAWKPVCKNLQSYRWHLCDGISITHVSPQISVLIASAPAGVALAAWYYVQKGEPALSQLVSTHPSSHSCIFMAPRNSLVLQHGIRRPLD